MERWGFSRGLKTTPVVYLGCCGVAQGNRTRCFALKVSLHEKRAAKIDRRKREKQYEQDTSHLSRDSHNALVGMLSIPGKEGRSFPGKTLCSAAISCLTTATRGLRSVPYFSFLQKPLDRCYVFYTSRCRPKGLKYASKFKLELFEAATRARQNSEPGISAFRRPGNKGEKAC